MSLALANAHKSAANRTRAEWLASVHMGVLTVPDLIQAATTEAGRPLRRITLAQLLYAQEDWGKARVEQTLAHLRSLLGTQSDHRLTVAWLIDARAGGRRLQAWADALQPRVEPWTGFPFAPSPQGGGDNRA